MVWTTTRAPSDPSPPTAAEPALTARRRARWVLLAFTPSSLMMAVTTHITTDVAAIPLLWVAPLALYLLTFILMFMRRPPVSLEAVARLFPLLVVPVLIGLVGQPAQLQLMLAIDLAFLVVTGLVCHGQLAHDRPGAGHLTEFYLWLAAGGALGGVFNALIAPLVFRSVAEYPIVVALACALAPAPSPPAGGLRPRVLDVLLPALVGLIAWGVVRGFQVLGVEFVRPLQILLVALLIVPVFAFTSRPLRFGLGVGALLLANPAELERHLRLLHSERSFFGVSRVQLDPGGAYHNLFHGSTLHGVQRIRPARCREPLGYYGRSGPLGDLFGARREAGTPLSVAVLGLGAGGTLAYAQPGDRWTAYEIDPAVVRIASEPTWFCFLSTSPVRPAIVLGDARLSLASSSERYDVLVLDAYSSDAIPVHLVTREALRVYLDRLAPNGMIAFHISNQFFDLAPVVARLAQDAGLVARIRVHQVLTREEISSGMFPSTWVVMARRPADLHALASAPEWRPLTASARTPLWTDDFSSLFAALKRS